MQKADTSGLLAQPDTAGNAALQAMGWSPRGALIACVFLVLYLGLHWIGTAHA